MLTGRWVEQWWAFNVFNELLTKPHDVTNTDRCSNAGFLWGWCAPAPVVFLNVSTPTYLSTKGKKGTARSASWHFHCDCRLSRQSSAQFRAGALNARRGRLYHAAGRFMWSFRNFPAASNMTVFDLYSQLFCMFFRNEYVDNTYIHVYRRVLLIKLDVRFEQITVYFLQCRNLCWLSFSMQLSLATEIRVVVCQLLCSDVF